MSTVYNFTSKETFCWSLQIFILGHQIRAVEHPVLTASVQEEWNFSESMYCIRPHNIVFFYQYSNFNNEQS